MFLHYYNPKVESVSAWVLSGYPSFLPQSTIQTHAKVRLIVYSQLSVSVNERVNGCWSLYVTPGSTEPFKGIFSESGIEMSSLQKTFCTKLWLIEADLIQKSHVPLVVLISSCCGKARYSIIHFSAFLKCLRNRNIIVFH